MTQTELTRSVFVARQPILDREETTHAYELLFRSGLENRCGMVEGDMATLEVIARTFTEIGVDELTAGKPCFVNFTRKLLLDRTAMLLPREFVTVEVLEDIEPDAEVIEACRELREAGYTLALDDFVPADRGHPLLDVVSMVKVDLMGATREEWTELGKELAERGICALAEKVETREEFEISRDVGYSYFQGYFFSKPVIKEGKALSPTNLAYLRLLQEVHQPELSLAKLEETIKQDSSLAYQLLRFINSAWFGLRTEIKSIRHALVWLGPPEIRKWFAIVSLRKLVADKPGELMIQALTRGRMAESLAEPVGMRDCASDLFLMGMFSMLDAMLDSPMETVLEKLPIAPQIKSALLGDSCPFRNVYDLILAFEQGHWAALDACAASLGVREEVLQTAFAEAAGWAAAAFGLSN